MALRIVTAACKAVADRSRAEIVVESTLGMTNGSFNAAFDELNETKSRSDAQAYAATLGMSSPRINGNVIGPYAVNSDGVPLDEVKREDENGNPLPPQSPQFQPAHYRITVPLCAPIL